MPTVTTGLEQLLNAPPPWIADRRLGLLCNPASVNQAYDHARNLIHRRFPGQLKALYAPQHGFFAEKQDNMIESADLIDPLLGLPVFSLYGDTRIPTRGMFDPIDTLLIDLQDVGTRVYTFMTTVSHCLEAARRFDKQVVILDRPNPIGGLVQEGNCLDPAWASFVGRYPIPMRHGLTIGELAQLFNIHHGIGCDLCVVPMEGWRRDMYFPDTGLPWVLPSPNLPTWSSALVYPGQVLWEGTNISEGRGTALPFEMFGAPFLDLRNLVARLDPEDFPGMVLRPVGFEPTANKWTTRPCAGFQLHVTHPTVYRPYMTTIRLLHAILHAHGEQFQWKPPPYEYEYDRMPIDLIIGSRDVRRSIANARSPDDLVDIATTWQDDLAAFGALSRQFQLYK